MVHSEDEFQNETFYKTKLKLKELQRGLYCSSCLIYTNLYDSLSSAGDPHNLSLLLRSSHHTVSLATTSQTVNFWSGASRLMKLALRGRVKISTHCKSEGEKRLTRHVVLTKSRQRSFKTKKPQRFCLCNDAAKLLRGHQGSKGGMLPFVTAQRSATNDVGVHLMCI